MIKCPKCGRTYEAGDSCPDCGIQMVLVIEEEQGGSNGSPKKEKKGKK